MAFTDAQLVQLRKWLGYPQLNRYRDTRLESAFAVVGADVEASAEVVAILAQLVDIDAAVGTSLTTTAGLKRADEVEWYPGSKGGGTAQVEALTARGRTMCSRLSDLFGVPLWGDAWGKQGYAGDFFMGRSFQYGGGVFGLG